VTSVLLAGCIDEYSHALAYSHVFELSFFEVRRDPDVFQRDHLHQLLAGLHILANFYGTVANHAADWRNDFRICQVELSLFQLSFFSRRCGFRGLSAGAHDRHLLGRSMGRAQTRFCLGKLGLRLGDLLCRGVGSCACALHRCSTRFGVGYRLIILLQRDLLFVDKLLVAHQVTLRLGVIGLGLAELSFCSLELLFRRIDSGAGVFDVGRRSRKLTSRADRRDRHV